MPTLNDFYVQAREVAPPHRRWAVGAAYRIAEAVGWGESIASARARILSIPRAYSAGLVSAGLDDEYALIDDVGGGGSPSGPLEAATILNSGTLLAAGGLA